MLAAFLALATISNQPTRLAPSHQEVEDRERTCFQTGSFYNPRIHIPADVAIVYGIDKTMPDRVKSWRDAGYSVSLMTGVAWGEYQDYLYGRFDGINHENEAQQEKSGYKISHGGDVYYMSPGPSYGKFLSQGVLRAIDAGVEAVYLEEPEFWVRGGYGDGFKQEWQKMYGTPWQDPLSSVDARWKANKLMYALYRRALQQVFDAVQAYNKKTNKRIRCYVATHSLPNYASWGIVSPESSLAKLKGCDGYIAQVWTGTARTPNVYKGERKERTFETAYLEYGAAMNMVEGTDKRMTFLADPIEDNPNHDWGDYRRNWESCVVASLLHSEVNHYEVMPWPERIFNGNYPSEADHSKRVPIPDAYATEIQIVCHALNEQSQFGFAKPWQVLLSDSLMFERGGPQESDPDLNHIYGLALPLIERGIPVVPAQLENLSDLIPLKIGSFLLMTYEGMKPLTPGVHNQIAKWVKEGGHLIVVDNDGDPFNNVTEWWTKDFKNPRQHLFKTLGLDRDLVGKAKVGKGTVERINQSPSALAHQPEGDAVVASPIKKGMPQYLSGFVNPRALDTNRFPFEAVGKVAEGTRGLAIAPRMPAEKGSPARPYRLVDLFDPELQVVEAPDPNPEGRHFYRWIEASANPSPSLLALAGTSKALKITKHSVAFQVSGIEGTGGIALIQTPTRPSKVTVGGAEQAYTWDAKLHLVWIKFPNHASGQNISVTW